MNEKIWCCRCGKRIEDDNKIYTTKFVFRLWDTSGIDNKVTRLHKDSLLNRFVLCGACKEIVFYIMNNFDLEFDRRLKRIIVEGYCSERQKKAVGKLQKLIDTYKENPNM